MIKRILLFFALLAIFLGLGMLNYSSVNAEGVIKTLPH